MDIQRLNGFKVDLDTISRVETEELIILTQERFDRAGMELALLIMIRERFDGTAAVASD